MITGDHKQPNNRRALLKRWYVLWLVTAGLILYPINNFPLRISTLFAFVLLLAGLIHFFWQQKLIRIFSFGVVGIIAALFLLPGRDYESARLREKYVASLAKYEGTRYVWGGENRLGIDCSGLVRSGLIIANYQSGLLAWNPRLVREGFSLWWNDCSAKALGEQYQQRTRRVFSAESINEIDYSKIMPGDFAVTEDGIHTLAYLGDQLWIEADPDVKKVIKVHVPAENPWFHQPVKIMRWTQFEH
jgi:hypothetical protein